MKNYDFNHVKVVYTGEKEELSDRNTWIFLFYCNSRFRMNDYTYKNDLAEKFHLISMNRRKSKEIHKGLVEVRFICIIERENVLVKRLVSCCTRECRLISGE
ncbi:hypothetical protein CN944_10560 [Bacillus thuringiensis]|nr:hypothetical protein CN426_11840 [Bacillus thuringiensis]PGL80970.1 hypothetical protein CN944_10560 [Bacillus thuringiensis]